MTALELDQAITAEDSRVTGAQTAVFIQCVGSREPDRPYCSKVCCTHSVESALELKKLNPEMDIFILYRDIRTFGVREDLYREARNQGIFFIRFDLENKPEVQVEDGRLTVTVIDHVLGQPITLEPDLLTLASAIIPNPVKELVDAYKVSLNSEGFLLEAHMKLRPVDFATEGIYLCGLAHYPKPIDESIAQAQAAAGRALTLLAKDTVKVGGVVAVVNPELCAVCLTCVRACPFNVPVIGDERGGRDRCLQMPGVRGLRVRMSGQGHHPAAFYRQAGDRQGGCLDGGSGLKKQAQGARRKVQGACSAIFPWALCLASWADN